MRWLGRHPLNTVVNSLPFSCHRSLPTENTDSRGKDLGCSHCHAPLGRLAPPRSHAHTRSVCSAKTIHPNQKVLWAPGHRLDSGPDLPSWKCIPWVTTEKSGMWISTQLTHPLGKRPSAQRLPMSRSLCKWEGAGLYLLHHDHGSSFSVVFNSVLVWGAQCRQGCPPWTILLWRCLSYSPARQHNPVGMMRDASDSMAEEFGQYCLRRTST